MLEDTFNMRTLTESINRVLLDVRDERFRQEELVAKKFQFTCSDPTIGDIRKLAVLAEEFGEVSREICTADSGMDEKLNKENLRAELIQVAAVCVAWAESL